MTVRRNEKTEILADLSAKIAEVREVVKECIDLLDVVPDEEDTS